MSNVIKVSGPLVIAEGMRNANMFDVVRVGKERLIGEIIEMHEDRASIQVYEETAGLGPGVPVETTGTPLSVELGPGMIEQIYDGIQRPLAVMMEQTGSNIQRGTDVPALSREKKWAFQPVKQPGDRVQYGDILGTVQETVVVEHRIMVPKGMDGKIVDIKSGEFTITDVICTIQAEDGTTHEVCMLTKWPVRTPRPYLEKLSLNEPLVTGQRPIDAMFPIAKGGVAAIPGPFGSGKTVTQHQLAKWASADIVIYIGCGERGNEMTDVLNEFPEIKDPKTGQSLMKRTVLIANTSDMPVAAREACIYTGITIAEYFRDMGYSVALMADSTSRWAEALREMSGRLEEMPGEEGYPAYLGSRLAQFYERAGKVRCLAGEERTGAVSAIGAVSPPGGDISEPVSQATLRIVKVFWGLDAQLAYRRHFPAINWLNSYSLYVDNLMPWYAEHIDRRWPEMRAEFLRILQQEAELDEIVKLVGIDALSKEDRLRLEVARSVREDFLQQDAMDDIDTYSSHQKMCRLMQLILGYQSAAQTALQNGADIEAVIAIPARERIGRAKFTPEGQVEEVFAQITKEMQQQLEALTGKEVE